MARSLISIDDLADGEIDAIFRQADRILADMATPGKPHRVSGRSDLAHDYLLATLFFEPSTRTRLSFESAMLRLGGRTISAAEAGSTSAAKGETIADTVRVVENYADVIVIRHSYEGAARVASEYCDVPVVNAGDGGHEHPTQTLCDLYTLRQSQKQEMGDVGIEALKDLNVVLWGDLRHGRTVHSLAFALARFGARVVPLAAPGCAFPDHVVSKLARDYGCLPLSKQDVAELVTEDFPADVLYVTPDEPHQLALLSDVWFRLSEKQQAAIKSIKSFDAFYSTRLQRERLEAGESPDYPMVDKQFLQKRAYRTAKVLHPLPRVDELSYDIDQDERGMYFKQAAYGVPVRMALITSLLQLRPDLLSNEPPAAKYPRYGHPQGIACGNARCVTRQENEMRYLTPGFVVVDFQPLSIRCRYCDYELRPRVLGRASSHKYTLELAEARTIDTADWVLFADESAALEAGFTARKSKRPATPGSPV